MKAGAIFDMDGLLFDTEKVYKASWAATAKYYGKARGEEIAVAVSGTGDEVCRRTIHEFYPDLDVEEFFKRVVDTAQKNFEHGVEMMAGVEEILQFFKTSGVKMAVASSSPLWVVERNLAGAGIREYFVALVDSKKIARGKPEPDIFLKAAEMLNLAPENCYVFEDSYNGIRGAAAAGCVPVMIPDTSPATDEMQKLCGGIYENLSLAALAIQRGEI